MSLVKRVTILFFFTLITIFFGCKKTNPVEKNTVVIAIPADIERINPLYSFSFDEANINELLFLSLVKHSWDEKKGDLSTEPMLAVSWEWAKDSSSIIINIRNDVKWSDGAPLTIDDVIFSFDVYSDPEVQSYLYGTFKAFYTDKDNHIDIKKTFEKISDSKLKINFLPASSPSMYNLDFPIAPKHIYGKIKRKDLINAAENFHPVTSGAFMLEKWERNQSIILKESVSSFLHNTDGVARLAFKIIPEYASRLAQLKNNEIDLVEDIKPEDVKDLKISEKLQIVPVKGREYDYIGWNNIDPEKYSKEKRLVPNKLFGSSKVRRALSMAINRDEILKEYFAGGEYGSLANSPVSPIFKNAINPAITPYKYDLEQAKKLLAEDGWSDTNKDGIIEKKGEKFKFTLSVPTNKPRRLFAATLLKNSLKQIGIDFSIEQLEPGDFIEKLSKKSLNAWIAGWAVPLPLDLKISWYSDLNKTPMNFCSYQNKNVDLLLDEIEKRISNDQKNNLYKKLEEILYADQPVTFLFWIDNVVVYNKRIQNIDVNPLGVVHHCWKWSVK
jgi:peptide/nickel transport system substrate-binding protein